MEKWTPKSGKGKKIIPSFQQYYEETIKANEEGVDTMSEEMLAFLFECFSKTIVKEIRSTIAQMLENGEMTQEQMLAELEPLTNAINEKDEDKKMELIKEIGKKYSLMLNLLETEANGVPDDASSLFPE